MAEWIYFIHPPRDDFAATMTDAEKAVWSEHFARLQRLLAEGTLIMAGPTLGPVNTGIAHHRGTGRGRRARDHARRPHHQLRVRAGRATPVPGLAAAGAMSFAARTGLPVRPSTKRRKP